MLKNKIEEFYFHLTDHQTELCNLWPLIEFYFCIQSNTTECERGFSRMNIIKTKNRNSLETETLDYLLRISTTEETELEKITDDLLFERWNRLKNRKSNLIKK